MILICTNLLLPLSSLQLLGLRVAPALGITFAFGLIAWGMRAVTPGGAVAGMATTFLICVSAGPAAFVCVVAVFLLTIISTRIGWRRKLLDGTAERDGGRGAGQVLANLAAATLVSVPAVLHPSVSPIFYAAMIAGLAEAAADTVSSEIGQSTGHTAYLITTLRRTPVGTNGGITVAGTLAGAAAAWAVCFVAVWLQVMRGNWFLPALIAGFAGMIVDSLLGATLEGPGRLGNDAVNFLSSSSAVAVVLCYGIFLMM